jgi:hypothetical protein
MRRAAAYLKLDEAGAAIQLLLLLLPGCSPVSNQRQKLSGN